MTKSIFPNKFWVGPIFILCVLLYFSLLFLQWPIDEGYQVKGISKFAYIIFDYIFFSNSFFLNIANRLSVNFFIHAFCSILTTSAAIYIIVILVTRMFSSVRKE